MRKVIAISFLLVLLICGGALFFKNGRVALSPKKRTFTQLTDNEAFRHICRDAVAHAAVFSQFKRDPIYTLFYENTSEQQGEELCQYLKSQAPDLLDSSLLEQFRKEDELGNPLTYFYEGLGKFSPSTLRAIKVAHDVKQHFGPLDGYRVIEIGGGHGTQCKILKDLYPDIQYTIVDLPEALELAKKVLNALGLSDIRFVTPDALPNETFDLVLSNYTFTESGALLQKRYFNQIMRHAKKGYLTCNFFPKHFRVQPWKKEQLLKKFTNLPVELELLSEFPQTNPDHFLLVWK